MNTTAVNVRNQALLTLHFLVLAVIACNVGFQAVVRLLSQEYANAVPWVATFVFTSWLVALTEYGLRARSFLLFCSHGIWLSVALYYSWCSERAPFIAVSIHGVSPVTHVLRGASWVLLALATTGVPLWMSCQRDLRERTHVDPTRLVRVLRATSVTICAALCVRFVGTFNEDTIAVELLMFVGALALAAYCAARRLRWSWLLLLLEVVALTVAGRVAAAA